MTLVHVGQDTAFSREYGTIACLQFEASRREGYEDEDECLTHGLKAVEVASWHTTVAAVMKKSKELFRQRRNQPVWNR